MACPDDKKDFFETLLPLIRPMTARLALNEDLILALSAFENRWGQDAHNKVLHNLFGLTHAGGKNLSFPTDQACVTYFENLYGTRIRGIQALEPFIEAMKRIGYNSVNKKYYDTFRAVYASVLRYKAGCGVK